MKTIKQLEKKLGGQDKIYWQAYLNLFDEEFNEYILPLVEELAYAGDDFKELFFDNVVAIMSKFAAAYISIAIDNEFYISAQLIKQINIDELEDISKKNHCGFNMDLTRTFSIEIAENLESLKTI